MSAEVTESDMVKTSRTFMDDPSSPSGELGPRYAELRAQEADGHDEDQDAHLGEHGGHIQVEHLYSIERPRHGCAPGVNTRYAV